jgi:hypothetical protein
MLNIYHSFLEFPKEIQEKIHTGALGVKDAYKLTTKPKELWAPILAQAEADRLAELEAESKLDEKFLADEKKRAEAESKAAADKAALEAAEKVAEQAKADAAVKLEAAAAEYKVAQTVPAKDKEAKAKALEAFKAKEKEAKDAEKAASDALAAADKLKQKAEAANKLAAERAEKLAQARREALAKAQKEGGKVNIDKAAAKVGGNTGPVPLNAMEMRKVMETLALPGSFPKVSQIAQAIQRCFQGISTETQCFAELGFLTGERKERPKTLPKEK